jgi:hypothetical protein
MRPIRAALFLAVPVLVSFASRTAAAPTATCHCFRERAYDPADPPAADPYILANARSSLLSAAFGVSKATLVRAVMSGTAPEDLWIAHWAAARTGRDAASLLGQLSEAGSWRPALTGAKGLPPGFEAALAKGSDRRELAAYAVDDVARARLAVDPAVLAALRAAGATSEQVVVVLLVAPRLRASPSDLLARYRSGRATWGALLHEAGLAPEGIEAAVRSALR